MNGKIGIQTKNKIYSIENGFLLEYAIGNIEDYSVESIEPKVEYYKTHQQAIERLANILKESFPKHE